MLHFFKMRVNILVIDDEESICEILKYNLEKEGYDVDVAYSAEEALGLDIAAYSLLIVDVMMNRMSGFELVKLLKSKPATRHIPVIFCTALSSIDDTVNGLDMGGDDYITKPFVISTVLARVNAVLRRSKLTRAITDSARRGNYEPDITFRTLRINRNTKQCFIDGEVVTLTPNEFDMLLYFLEHRNRIHSRNEILNKVWPDDTTVKSHTVDVNVTRLRRKIGTYAAHLVTRVGYGYGFMEDASER